MPKPIVILESPYAGNIERNLAYARAAMKDSILRGEVPLASHLLYTQPGILRDDVPEERVLGINLGLDLRHVAALTVVYEDFGISVGMGKGIGDAKRCGRAITYRSLPAFVAAYVEAQRNVIKVSALASVVESREVACCPSCASTYHKGDECPDRVVASSEVEMHCCTCGDTPAGHHARGGCRPGWMVRDLYTCLTLPGCLLAGTTHAHATLTATSDEDHGL